MDSLQSLLSEEGLPKLLAYGATAVGTTTMLVGVASHVASNYADKKYQPILEKIEYGSYYIGGALFGAGIVASTFL